MQPEPVWISSYDPVCFSLSLEFLIPGTISKISMQVDLFVEARVGTQIEAKTSAFPLIAADPIVPRTDLIISNVLVTCANKLQRALQSLKFRHLEQFIDRAVDSLFIC